MSGTDADVAVVGAGLVGLAAARALLARRPGLRVVVLEKEADVARHQSGRNSGVVHSGLYYAPGSDRARDCRRGRELLLALCAERGVPVELRGKLVVASERAELPRLEALAERGRANGVACELVGPDGIRAREPAVRGVAALHVPEAGVVDFARVARALAGDVRAAGGELRAGVRVLGADEDAGGVRVRTSAGPLRVGRLVGCAGLHADRVARASGLPTPERVVPFRGAYRELRPEARALCRGLVYPVPDPALPFLGVHLTRTIDGRVTLGPSAVLALAREGYRARDVAPREVAGTLLFPGFRRLARRHWRAAAGELRRALSRDALARAARRLVPDLDAADLLPFPSGVRAQALAPDGRLVDDFLVRARGRQTHVLSAASPAATACLAIGERVAALALGEPGVPGQPPA